MSLDCIVFRHRTGAVFWLVAAWHVIYASHATRTLSPANQRLMELPEQVPGAEASQFRLLENPALPAVLSHAVPRRLQRQPVSQRGGGLHHLRRDRRGRRKPACCPMSRRACSSCRSSCSRRCRVSSPTSTRRSRLIRQTRLAEVVLMCCGAVALYIGNVPALLMVIFLLGVLATIFGPLKYSLMPQHLRQSELVGGNALVDAGTFHRDSHRHDRWRTARADFERRGRRGRRPATRTWRPASPWWRCRVGHVPVCARHPARGGHRPRAEDQFQSDHLDLRGRSASPRRRAPSSCRC